MLWLNALGDGYGDGYGYGYGDGYGDGDGDGDGYGDGNGNGNETVTSSSWNLQHYAKYRPVLMTLPRRFLQHPIWVSRTSN